jgi:hypothetical protein
MCSYSLCWCAWGYRRGCAKLRDGVSQFLSVVVGREDAVSDEHDGRDRLVEQPVTGSKLVGFKLADGVGELDNAAALGIVV